MDHRTHVVRFESALWQTTSLLLVAADQAVAIDPGISTDELAAIEERARNLGARVSDVLVTHADWDHVCGIAAFPDATATMGPHTAELVSSEALAERIEERAAAFELVVPGPPRVDRVVAVGQAHQVGPFALETFAMRGHTPDGTGYRIRELNIVAVGDHLSAVEFPFASSTAEYRQTLAGLIDLLRHDPPGQVVPGHGPSLTAPEALEIAEADLAYLRALRDAVKDRLSAGAERAEALEAGLAVELPRPAPDELEGMRLANVEAQLEELVPSAA
jgi:glyoxylase-like metal-dependent hydrolase (beta-lactamase superfamily II)